MEKGAIMKIWIAIGIFCFQLSLSQVEGMQKCSHLNPISPPHSQAELAAIDAVVLELTDLRNKELAHAAWAQNQGDRLQFQPHNLLDARRYWHEAEESRETAARYQQEINQLESRKKELLTNESFDLSFTD